MPVTLALKNDTPTPPETLAPPGARQTSPSSEHVNAALKRLAVHGDRRHDIDEAMLGGALLAVLDFLLSGGHLVLRWVSRRLLALVLPAVTWPLLGYELYMHGLVPIFSQVVGAFLIVLPPGLLLALIVRPRSLGRSSERVAGDNVVSIRDAAPLRSSKSISWFPRPSLVGRRVWRIAAIGGGLVIAGILEVGWLLGWGPAVELHASWFADPVDMAFDPLATYIASAVATGHSIYLIVPTVAMLLVAGGRSYYRRQAKLSKTTA